MRRFLITTGLLLISAVLFYYAAFVEPNRIEVTRHKVIAAVRKPIRIAHLTDLHLRTYSIREARVLAILAEEKPDLIVITGDNVSSTHDYVALGRLLDQMKAPLGVWSVRGNWENWRRIEQEDKYYASHGVHLLVNDAKPAGHQLWIAGFDDSVTGKPEVDGPLAKIPSKAYCLALFHSPGFFPTLAGRCQLSLAGHTHGGQIRIPGFGPLWMPKGSQDFISGWFTEEGSRLYVSRGIGTSVLPLRFNCPPEIAIITLEPEPPLRKFKQRPASSTK